METPDLILNEDKKPELIESKTYELKLDNEIYILNFKIISEEKMLFQAKNKTISLLSFEKEFTYKELIKNLFLQEQYYNNIHKIYKFYDISLTKNKISLLYDKNEKQLKLLLKKQIDYDNINCFLDLSLIQQSNELININIFSELIKIGKIKNEELKINIGKIQKENEELKINMEKIQKENEELKINMEKIQKENDELNINNKLSLNNNKNCVIGEKPNFEYVETLVNEWTNKVYNWDVYTGLKDNIQYLAYIKNNEDNENKGNLFIMNITNNKNIKKLKLDFQVDIIKYYSDSSKKEEYLLSSGKYVGFSTYFNIIVWDIQNDFNKDYHTK